MLQTLTNWNFVNMIVCVDNCKNVFVVNMTRLGLSYQMVESIYYLVVSLLEDLSTFHIYIGPNPRLAARGNERVRTSVIECSHSTRVFYIYFSKLVGPWLLPLLLMQSRGDVTYDVSCTRATWSVDRSDF